MERELKDLSYAGIQQVLGQDSTEFDLVEGTVRIADRERRIYITSETLYGVYKALSNETGDAWKIILKGCGADWGRKVLERLDKELAARTQKNMADVTVTDFCGFVEQFFAYYGWGLMQVDLSDAEHGGIVRCTLRNSLMAEAVKDVSGPVDFIVTGMLQAIFSRIAGTELDCIQVSCQRSANGSVCEFLVSAPERIERIENLAGQGSVDDAIAQLRAA